MHALQVVFAMTRKENGQMLRLMRNPEAPRVRRLKRLLMAEIERGNCVKTMARGLLNGFLSFEFDFVVDGDGELRWWMITDEDYLKMWQRGEIKPNE